MNCVERIGTIEGVGEDCAYITSGFVGPKIGHEVMVPNTGSLIMMD